MINNKKDSDDYFVCFRGAKITKQEAKKVNLSLFFGVLGVIASFLIPIEKNKFIDYSIIIIFTAGGYLLGNKVFKKK